MTEALLAPRANPHIFGHEAARARFQAAFRDGRLHHAWLFVGPAGIGKATLAWHCARWLLAADDDPTQATDPASPLFRMVASGAHPDLFALEAEQGRGGRLVEITVGRVREVIERVHATAFGQRRVVLVDPAEALNRSAANALLKLLEEPPFGLVFLLVSHRAAAVPETVASRCLRLALRPLDRATTEAVLAALCPDLSAEERARLAEFCQGCPGQAIRCADGRLFALYGRLLDWLADPAPPSGLLAFVRALEDHAADAGLAAATAVPALLVRRALDLRLGRNLAVELVAGERQRLEPLAARAPLAALPTLWEKLSALPRRIESQHLDPGQALITALDALARTLARPAMAH
jgi:DNA polymerase-3 subunit delta'